MLSFPGNFSKFVISKPNMAVTSVPDAFAIDFLVFTSIYSFLHYKVLYYNLRFVRYFLASYLGDNTFLQKAILKSSDM